MPSPVRVERCAASSSSFSAACRALRERARERESRAREPQSDRRNHHRQSERARDAERGWRARGRGARGRASEGPSERSSKRDSDSSERAHLPLDEHGAFGQVHVGRTNSGRWCQRRAVGFRKNPNRRPIRARHPTYVVDCAFMWPRMGFAGEPVHEHTRIQTAFLRQRRCTHALCRNIVMLAQINEAEHATTGNGRFAEGFPMMHTILVEEHCVLAGTICQHRHHVAGDWKTIWLFGASGLSITCFLVNLELRTCVWMRVY